MPESQKVRIERRRFISVLTQPFVHLFPNVYNGVKGANWSNLAYEMLLFRNAAI